MIGDKFSVKKKTSRIQLTHYVSLLGLRPPTIHYNRQDERPSSFEFSSGLWIFPTILCWFQQLKRTLRSFAMHTALRNKHPSDFLGAEDQECYIGIGICHLQQATVNSIDINNKKHIILASSELKDIQKEQIVTCLYLWDAWDLLQVSLQTPVNFGFIQLGF